MDLTGAAVLVTGGASGLGWASARRLAKRGARVVILDLPASAGLDQAEEFAQLAEAIIDNPMLNGETIRLDGAQRMASR